MPKFIPPTLFFFAVLSSRLLIAFLFFSFPSFINAATVAAVVDGDTIRLEDGRTVRYLGVNTPEYGQPLYEEAKRFNERLVAGKSIRLETDRRERDRYGRELAYVFVDDVPINSQIVAEGWGHVFLLQSLSRASEWLRLQKNAQDQRKGIWRDGLRGPLKITTVHANAKGDDRRNPNGEYLRLCNVSDKLVALQGFAVQDAAQHRFVFPSGTLDPGATVLLVSGPGKNEARRGQLVFYWGSGPIWNNDGDIASLFDPSGDLIDTFRVLGAVRQ
ncbi:MAG: lamin tail domain-containing protein [Candidatus Binatia bacterium]